jgi:hypothetical protein
MNLRKKERIEIQGMGCVTTVFQSEFSEYLGAITFVHLQIKVIAPYPNSRYTSAILNIIPMAIRSPPIKVIPSDVPKIASASFPLVYAEKPSRIINGGVP